MIRFATGIQFVLTILFLSASVAPPVSAQNGPPPHVRRSVDAVMELLASQDDASVGHFVDTAMPKKAVGNRDELIKQLTAVRAAVGGRYGDISVEAEPDGVRLILSRGEMRHQVRVALDEDGVSAIKLVEPAAKGASTAANPATDRNSATNQHLRALEELARGSVDERIKEFERDHLSKRYLEETTVERRRELLRSVRDAVDQAGGVMVGERDDTPFLELRGRKQYEVRINVSNAPPYLVDAIEIEDISDRKPDLVLTRSNLDETLRKMAASGFSGSVHVRLGGTVVLEKGYGTANTELGTTIAPNSAFGIGSTPIDFTVAAIFLLEQKGRVSLDDTIDKYFDDVPADKRSITLRHLITGRSGLQNFHDTSDDWDADLAWIDRSTAINRIVELPLLFAPGEGREHSHSAYGLVAAVIEMVSGQDYFGFVNEHFFRPAGMTRTGMNGTTNGLKVADFAEGNGASSAGLPNIPPNWGPTSWLVMGSGGMYSTLQDLLAFYRFVRSGDVLESRYADRFLGAGVGIGGSDRGFYVFHAFHGGDNEALIVTNVDPPSKDTQTFTRALERLIEAEPCPTCND